MKKKALRSLAGSTDLSTRVLLVVFYAGLLAAGRARVPLRVAGQDRVRTRSQAFHAAESGRIAVVADIQGRIGVLPSLSRDDCDAVNLATLDNCVLSVLASVTRYFCCNCKMTHMPAVILICAKGNGWELTANFKNWEIDITRQ